MESLGVCKCFVVCTSFTLETSLHNQGSHYFQIRGTTGQVTSLSESSQVEVGDNREKCGDFWEKLIAINRNILSRLFESCIPVIVYMSPPPSFSS